MKTKESLIVFFLSLVFLFIAVKVHYNVELELAKGCWERATWGMIFFSGSFAVSIYGAYLLLRKEHKKD